MLLYIMLAYLIPFAALSNAVCQYDAFLFILLPFIFANAFCFHALLTHSLFISSIILHYALLF